MCLNFLSLVAYILRKLPYDLDKIKCQRVRADIHVEKIVLPGCEIIGHHEDRLL